LFVCGREVWGVEHWGQFEELRVNARLTGWWNDVTSGEEGGHDFDKWEGLGDKGGNQKDNLGSWYFLMEV